MHSISSWQPNPVIPVNGSQFRNLHSWFYYNIHILILLLSVGKCAHEWMSSNIAKELTRIIMSNKFRPDLPPATSEAAVVQDFFAKILIDEYNVSQERAQQVSLKWELGKSREVTTFSKASYICIFGHEAGEILFANLQKLRLQQRQSDHMSNRSK